MVSYLALEPTDLFTILSYETILLVLPRSSSILENEFWQITGWKIKVQVAQLCPILCDRLDCRLPGSSVHGILQARVLEWVAISYIRVSSQPRDQTQSPALQVGFLPSEPPGKPRIYS